jgi:hypothetical protein
VQIIAVDWSGRAKGAAESLWRAEVDPFWGCPGRRNPHPKARLYRRTERSEDSVRPKSVFQIRGAGTVGTGSIRGMPHLLTLAKNGFGIWPLSEGCHAW